MRPLIVKQLDYDLTPVAGLALVGHHLNWLAPVFQQLDASLPVRNGVAKRRRIKTVMQELICRAGRVIEHGRRLILRLGANDRSARAFQRLHGELFAACG